MYASALPLDVLTGVCTLQRFSRGVGPILSQALDLGYQPSPADNMSVFTAVRSSAAPRSDALPSAPVMS